MADLRDVLDREAGRIEPDSDALEGVRQRVRRRERARRALTGVVVVGLVGASLGLAVRAFDRTAVESKGSPAQQVLPIWPPDPHGTAERIDALQQQVDEGARHTELTHPRLLARDFAMAVLQWDPSEIEVDVLDRDPVRLSIRNPTLAAAAGSLRVPRTILDINRWRGRSDGIFVISRASSDSIQLSSPIPGQAVDPRGISFEGQLAFLPEGGGYEAGLFQYRMTSAEYLSTHTASPTRRIEARFDDVPLDVRFAAVALVDPEQRILSATAFPLAGAQLEAERPTPGPTPTSDDATPAPVPVILEVDDVVARWNATTLLGLLLGGEGRAADHGGYEVVMVGKADPTNQTVIYADPRYEHEAERVRDLFLHDVEIRLQPRSDAIAMRIHLGSDFYDAHRGEIKVVGFVREFLEARLDGAGAEPFLSADAAERYERREGGLSLYDYDTRANAEFSLTGWVDAGEGSFKVVVAIERPSGDRIYETLLVATRILTHPEDPQPEIVYAERNA